MSLIRSQTIQEHDFIFGLNWQMSTKTSLKSDIKVNADKSGQSFAINRVNSVDDDCQFSLSDEELVKGKYSTADLMTSVWSDENFIYFYQLSDDEVWCCIVFGGQIALGGDIILPADGFIESYNSLLIDLSLSEEKFSIFCDENCQDDVADKCSATLNLLDVYENIPDKSFLNEFYSLKKEKTFVFSKKKIAIAAALAVTVAGGLLIFNEDEVVIDAKPVFNVDDMRKKLPQSRERALGDFVNQKIGPSRTQILEEAYQEEVSWHNIDFNLLDESKLIFEISSFLKNHKIFRGGWVSKQYVFDFAQSGFHELLWLKEKNGTALTLKQNIESQTNGNLYFDDKGTAASSFHQLPSVKPETDKDVKVLMAKSSNNVIEFMHDLDKGYYFWFASKRNIDERPVAIAGISNLSEAKKRQFRYQSKSFRINGSGIKQLESLGYMLLNHERFMIERIVFDFDNNFKWLVYGVFYEHEQK